MSLLLARSGGVEIKTHPTSIVGPGKFLRIRNPTQEEQVYFDQGIALAEVDYSLGQIEEFRPQAAAGLQSFRRYLGSFTEQLVENPFTGRVEFGDIRFLGAGSGYLNYQIPELPTDASIDWCGVLLHPTDVLHAAHYVISNTPIEPNDQRPDFIQSLAESN